MKRYRHILITLTLILFVVSAFGKPVSITEVRVAVNSLMLSWNKNLEIEGIQARYLPGGELGYYMVDLGQDGWVMVSADDVMRPVLAYSFEHRMTPESEWNDAASYLLNLYQEEITISLKDKDLQRDARWDRAKLPSEQKAATADPVLPFIDVTWNQGGGWNMFCPIDETGPSDRVYVGCVAVAMAQAMSVYEYPPRPQGIKSYIHEDYGSIAVNYDNADPYEWNEMSATSYDSSNAMLLYHCAVSVEMNFGPDGSGAYVRTARSSLSTYFGYSRNLMFKDRYEDADAWEALLVEELAAGRPIVYRGVNDDGGHAWNLDGYYDGSFHMNFGWSGSQNGYYTLDYISPGSSTYGEDQGALIGISLPVSAPYDITLSELTILEDLAEDSFMADVMVEDEDPENVYSFTCKGKYSVILDDYRPASFYITDGKLFTDKVFVYDEANPEANIEYLRIIVEDQYGNEYSEDFEIAIEKIYMGPAGIALSDTSVLEKQPEGTAVAKLTVEDEDSSNSYTYTLYGPYNDEISGYDPASFYMDGDSLRTFHIFDRAIADTCYLLVELIDSHGNELSREFTIQIDPDQSGSNSLNTFSLFADLVYPNPANEVFWFRNSDLYRSLEIFEISTGRKLAEIEPVGGQIDVSELVEGIYLLKIRTKQDEILLQKLFIQH